MGSKKGKKGKGGATKTAKGSKSGSGASSNSGPSRQSKGGGAADGGSALSISALMQLVLDLYPDMEDAGGLLLLSSGMRAYMFTTTLRGHACSQRRRFLCNAGALEEGRRTATIQQHGGLRCVKNLT